MVPAPPKQLRYRPDNDRHLVSCHLPAAVRELSALEGANAVPHGARYGGDKLEPPHSPLLGGSLNHLSAAAGRACAGGIIDMGPVRSNSQRFSRNVFRLI